MHEEVGDPVTGKPIGPTADNLAAAVASAREESFAEIAAWFETLAKAEKSHAGRFRRALDQLA